MATGLIGVKSRDAAWGFGGIESPSHTRCTELAAGMVDFILSKGIFDKSRHEGALFKAAAKHIRIVGSQDVIPRGTFGKLKKGDFIPSDMRLADNPTWSEGLGEYLNQRTQRILFDIESLALEYAFNDLTLLRFANRCDFAYILDLENQIIEGWTGALGYIQHDNPLQEINVRAGVGREAACARIFMLDYSAFSHLPHDDDENLFVQGRVKKWAVKAFLLAQGKVLGGAPVPFAHPYVANDSVESDPALGLAHAFAPVPIWESVSLSDSNPAPQTKAGGGLPLGRFKVSTGLFTGGGD